MNTSLMVISGLFISFIFYCLYLDNSRNFKNKHNLSGDMTSIRNKINNAKIELEYFQKDFDNCYKVDTKIRIRKIINLLKKQIDDYKHELIETKIEFIYLDNEISELERKYLNV